MKDIVENILMLPSIVNQQMLCIYWLFQEIYQKVDAILFNSKNILEWENKMSK